MLAAEIEHLLGFGDAANRDPERLFRPIKREKADKEIGFSGAPNSVRLPSGTSKAK
jgi:hypothetical protein